MAQIKWDDLHRIEKARYNVHNKVRTTYSTFLMNGQKYVQIDTYGENTRATPNSSSQTIQFDKESAVNLINLLKKEFCIE